MSTAKLNPYQKYFDALLSLMKRRRIGLRTPLETYSGQFQIIDSWPGPIHSAVNILRGKKEIRVDVTLKSREAHDQFLLLEKEKRAIEEIVGRANWDDRDSPKKERYIAMTLKADPTDESDWPRQHAWLAARLVAFRLAFEPRIERS